MRSNKDLEDRQLKKKSSLTKIKLNYHIFIKKETDYLFGMSQ